MNRYFLIKTVIALFLFFFAFPAFATEASQGTFLEEVQNFRGEWKFLGSRTVNYRSDRDVIHLHQRRSAALSAIEFRTSTRNVYLRRAEIIYRDGRVQEIKFRKHKTAGNSIIVELPRRAGPIDKIVIWSKKRRGNKQQYSHGVRPEVQIWGLRSYRNYRNGWDGRNNRPNDYGDIISNDRRDRRNRRR